MPNTALITLAEYADAPSDQIGHRAHDLGRLHTKEVPIPRSFCIPERTLRIIAETNNLKLKLSQLLNKAQFNSQSHRDQTKKQLVQFFSNLQVPRNIATEIITTYHQYLGADYVHVLPSNSPNNEGSWIHDNVKGDANVIDSLLQVWAEIVFANAAHSLKKSPMHTLLFSSPLLVEWAPAADSSGVAYTKDPNSGSKTEITIHGTLGIYHPEQSKDVDILKVDVRTWNVISQQITQKKQKFTRGHESLSIVEIPTNKQKEPILTREQAANLAKITFNIKQQSLEQQKVHWVLVNHQLFITAIEPFATFSGEEYLELHNQKGTASTENKTVKTAVSLYVSAGNPAKAGEQVHEYIDGIGVLRSEYTIAKFGLHPLHVLKSKTHRTLLKEDLVQTITTYQQKLRGRPLIYRTQNFTSAELKELKFATLYEPDEPNPYLGYRGGLKITTQSELFTFELEAIKEALSKNKQQVIGCMLPFIRTPGELRSAIDKISALGLLHQANFKIWLQLNTPENILNLAAYPLEHVAAVSLNVRSLHGLISGVDPDNGEMLSRYPLPNEIILHLVEHTLEGLKTEHLATHPTKVFVHMEQFDAHVAAEAIRKGINGLIVKPQVARIARECIIDTEATRFTKG